MLLWFSRESKLNTFFTYTRPLSNTEPPFHCDLFTGRSPADRGNDRLVGAELASGCTERWRPSDDSLGVLLQPATPAEAVALREDKRRSGSKYLVLLEGDHGACPYGL